MAGRDQWRDDWPTSYETSAALQLLWGGALVVLLIAAANIIGLSPARGTRRLKELATRPALGGDRLEVIAAFHGRQKWLNRL